MSVAEDVYGEGVKDGAKAERVAIMKWLRTLQAMQYPQILADAILKGDHLPEKTD